MNNSDNNYSLQNRNQALNKFNHWEKEHPMHLNPSVAIEGLDLLFSLLPQDSKNRQFNPQGIIAMHKALAHLK